MAKWGTMLVDAGGLGDEQRRRLQALAITTVEDLRFAIHSTPEPMAKLLGLSDFTGILPPLEERMTLDVETFALQGAPPGFWSSSTA